MKKGGVHQRRTRFVKEFLLEQNATKAAIAAGCSEKSARQQGERLLTNASIRAEIEQKNTELNQKYDLTADRIKLELARLCYYNPADYFNPDGSPKAISELSEDASRAIAGFDMTELFAGSGEERGAVGYIKKFKLADKVRALELAARVQKMLVERIEVTGMDALAEELAKARKRSA